MMIDKATLLVALLLSATAAWYSISGLTAIFSAAVIPVIIMGVVLEAAKIITSLWLHKYWDICGWKLKIYLVPAVVILAIITSVGIFGFLSKAHSEQSLVNDNAVASLEQYSIDITFAENIIRTNKTTIDRMQSQVDQLLERSDDTNGVLRAARLREAQRSERDRLLLEINEAQSRIASLSKDSAPLRAEVRGLEAEVGPIKYISAAIYGSNLSKDNLEEAVIGVIILLIVVFDPLALALVVASQKHKVVTEVIEEKEEQPMSKGIYNSKYFENHQDEASLDAILYVVVLVNEKTSERECVKIGITKGKNWKDAIKRASGFRGYDIRIQKIVPGRLEDVYYLEEYLHELWAEHRYYETHKFGGHTECFQIEKLKEILASVPDSC